MPSTSEATRRIELPVRAQPAKRTETGKVRIAGLTKTEAEVLLDWLEMKGYSRIELRLGDAGWAVVYDLDRS